MCVYEVRTARSAEACVALDVWRPHTLCGRRGTRRVPFRSSLFRTRLRRWPWRNMRVLLIGACPIVLRWAVRRFTRHIAELEHPSVEHVLDAATLVKYLSYYSSWHLV